MITFVTFHVDIADELLYPEIPIDSSRSLEYRELLLLMFRSVSVFHPDARKVILTDERSVFADLPDDIEVRCYQVDASNVMLSRSYAQLEFLKAHDFKSNVVFLDTDILVNTNLEVSLSWSEFDVALTVRDDPQGMPVNGGIMFISKRQSQAAINFFEAFYQRYVDSFSGQAQWWGDQKALADILTDAGEDLLLLSEKKVNETLFHLLPCETYNYSPNFEEEIDTYGADLNKKIIHFKGHRKRFMKPFWDSCISSKLCRPDVQIDRLQHQMHRLQTARKTLKKESNINRSKHLLLLENQRLLKKQNADLKARYTNLKVQHRSLKVQHRSLTERPFEFVLLALKKRFEQQLRGLKLL